MSFVIADPEMVTAAAADLAGIRPPMRYRRPSRTSSVRMGRNFRLSTAERQRFMPSSCAC